MNKSVTAISATPGSQPARKGFRRGGTLLEAAIVLLTLSYLVFGMIEFGYYFYVKNAMEGAAREGARAGVISGNDNTAITTAAQNAMVGFNIANYTVSVTDTSGNALAAGTASAGTQIEVTVSATWSTIGAGFRPMNLIGGTKTVKGVCVMRKES
jgi:Flp pilus assembly protein TadG